MEKVHHRSKARLKYPSCESSPILSRVHLLFCLLGPDVSIKDMISFGKVLREKVRTSLLRGVRLEVRNYVPYVCSGKGKVSTPAVEDVEVPEDVEVFEDAEVPAPADAGDGDHLFKTRFIDGCLQCPRCYQNIGTTTDARIATEVARREAMRANRDTEDKVTYMVHCVIWPRTTGDKLSKRGTRTSLTAPGRA